MNVRRALIPLLCAMCMFVSGCSDNSVSNGVSTDTGAPSTVVSETQQPVLPSETTQAAATSASTSVLSMIPLPPDREYVEVFDPDDRTIELYNPCDDFTAEELAEMGLEKITDTAYNGTRLIDCGMHVPHQRGAYEITTHLATFENIRSRGFMIDATFPDADDRVYFSRLNSDTEDHCDAAISTKDGRLSVTYNHPAKDVLGKDELCRRAYEVLQKLRAKGGY